MQNEEQTNTEIAAAEDTSKSDALTKEPKMPDNENEAGNGDAENSDKAENTATGETDKQKGRGKRQKGGKKSHVKPFLGGLLTGILVVCLAGAAAIPYLESTGVLVHADTGDGSAVNSSSLEKLRQLEQVIDDYYYEPETVTTQSKEDGLYKGLLESLGDPYSEYYTEDEMTDLTQDLTGTYGGIGAYISTDKTTGYPMIAGVIAGTPAEEAGLRANDIIYEVDGESVADKTLDQVVSKVRGEEGTDVTLTIVRTGESDYLHITITRANVDSPLVSSKVMEDDSSIGYIRLTQFGTVATNQFKEALSDLYDEGIQGLILDIRDNPGGDVDVVTAIADEIIPEGLVFYMEDRDGKRTEYTADGEDEISIPLVVLVNGNSASASEILSGAIQDSGVGIIMGTQTYGKGVVQTLMSLRDGSAVKITIAHYFTRNGNDINKVGITPDIAVDFDYDAYYEDRTDNQLEKAEEVIRDLMDGESMEKVIEDNKKTGDDASAEDTEADKEDSDSAVTDSSTAGDTNDRDEE